MLTSAFMTNYYSVGVWAARTMTSSSLAVEVWAVIEGIFYVILFLHRKWLNSLDTLELSLLSAPMLETRERAELWSLMVDTIMDDGECSQFLSGWFFGEKLEKLTKYDVMDFLTWSLFEGRNIEHLTQEELNQLRGFVSDLEYMLSIELHGVEMDETEEISEDGKYEDQKGDTNVLHSPSPTTQRRQTNGMQPREFPDVMARRNRKGSRQKPKDSFHFQESRHVSTQTYFSNLYESYNEWCEQYRERNRNFHPVEDIRNFVAEKSQQVIEAEQSAVATASESLSSISENAYFTLIEKDGKIDKQLTALSHATQSQLADAWNSMWKMKERLRTASDISSRRKALQQQLKSYRQTLAQMRAMATAVPSNQMAELMRKITQCYEALEGVETSAMNAFMQVTGYVGKNLLQSKEPPRYQKYSCDPLMDVASYPLMFHILILLATDGGLRVLMKLRGFQRLRVGPVSYYYHPGNGSNGNEEVDSVPIVFCHGIGIGHIFYMTLIDELLGLGRPLILPEIPYVSGFRPWLSPTCVLPPAAVTSSLMSILACHGHARGAFLGHSYGTSWVSFMCKYAPNAVAAVLFLDPICFCLHCPRLTKKFVYHRADPGSTSHMIRTDVNINWTIQRGFPWTRISLFTEQIPCVPCAIFLSDQDALVPAAKVEKYLKSKGAIVLDASEVCGHEHFQSFSRESHPINVTIFRNQGHGDWPLELSANRQVAQATRALVNQIRPVDNDDLPTY
jgi:pimeloyl-ACP methyl ester carboxylesterase